ncbi:MAG: dihydroneopterin aldolase [Puniceicoccales bacterium]|jgi:dihydroneopterin aldolase|nr:dihydroneopterin aldolase [Puniceicoccales bacterium]
MEDNIFFQDLHFFAKHGFHDLEKKLVQKFSISLRIFGDFSAAMHSDNIAHTIDYSAAYEVIKCTVEGNKFCLIERLAREIALNIFGKFSSATTLEISVKKYPLSWKDKHYGSVGFSAKISR